MTCQPFRFPPLLIAWLRQWNAHYCSCTSCAIHQWTVNIQHSSRHKLTFPFISAVSGTTNKQLQLLANYHAHTVNQDLSGCSAHALTATLAILQRHYYPTERGCAVLIFCETPTTTPGLIVWHTDCVLKGDLREILNSAKRNCTPAGTA